MCIFGSCFNCKCNFCNNKKKIKEQEELIKEQIILLKALQKAVEEHTKKCAYV
tara:strand:- start:987 stop:1145 length:159 start_codon:yes stop_codon:yes gene_type:complete